MSLGQGEARQQTGYYSCRPKSRCIPGKIYVQYLTKHARSDVYSRLCSLRAGFGCASEPETRGVAVANSRAPGKRAPSRAAAGDDKAMDMQMSIGVSTSARWTGHGAHVPAMVDCFERAGDARRYLSGQIVLRFVVEASGSVSNIHVVKNELGNYPVERCLIGAGMRIAFPPPEGNRRTDFEYSLRFRSTGEMRVLDWRVTTWPFEWPRPTIFPVAESFGAAEVEAIAYVEPAGTIGSVGFVSQGPINPVAASCAEEQMLQAEDQRRPSQCGATHGVSADHCRPARQQGRPVAPAQQALPASLDRQSCAGAAFSEDGRLCREPRW